MAEQSTLEADLPLPAADSGRLSIAAASLLPVACRATEPLAGGAPRSWWGAARADADAEVARMRSIAADVAVRAGTARARLAAYVSELVSTRSTILQLRQEWQAGDRQWRTQSERLERLAHDQSRTQAATGGLAGPAVDVPARQQQADAAWARLRADLCTRHGTAVRALDAQRELCVAALHSCGHGIPGADPTEMRAAVIAQLPLGAAALRTAEARRTVDGLISRAGRPPAEWDHREAELLAGLRVQAGDPFLAQELLGRIPPETLHRIVQRLLPHSVPSHRTGEAGAALDALAGMLVAAVDGRLTRQLPASERERMATWRATWLTVAAGKLAVVTRAGVGERYAGIDAQAELLRRAHALGFGPGVDYVRIMGPAFVTADITRLPPPDPTRQSDPDVGLALPRDLGRGEPLRDLLASLQSDTEAARALLAGVYGRYPDGSDRQILDYLLTDRPLSRARHDVELGREFAAILREVALEPGKAGAESASAFLDALARGAARARSFSEDDQLGRHATLDDARRLAAVLLATRPEALSWVLFRGRDFANPAIAVPLPGGGWSFVIASRERAADLLGEIARARVHPGQVTSDAGEIPGILAAVAAEHSRELAAALATGTRPAAASAVQRMAQTIGFAVTAANLGLTSLHGAQDAINRRQHATYQWILDQAQVPSGAKKGVPGAVATCAEALIRGALQAWLDGAFPSDSADASTAVASRARRQLEDELRRSAWDLVSAAGGWDPAHDPRRWDLPPGGTPFWGADGHPKPLAELDEAARATMEIWASAVPEYVTLPAELLAALRQGAASAS